MSEKNIGVGMGVMIVRNGRVLLGLRHPDPTKAGSQLQGAGTWTMPGGKYHFGESFEAGAVREALEETGLMLKEKSLKLISISNDRVSDAHFVTLGFLCQDTDGEPQVWEPDKIIEWQWFPLDQLPTPMYFPSQKILKKYQAGKIYLPDE